MTIGIGKVVTYTLPTIENSDNSTVKLILTSDKPWISAFSPNSTTEAYTLTFKPPINDFASVGITNLTILLNNSNLENNTYLMNIEVTNSEPYFEQPLNATTPLVNVGKRVVY